MCWWDFDNVTQIGFKGPKDHETNQQNCSCSFCKKLWGVQLGHSASESNQPGTSTTDFNQERGRERETQRVTWTVTSLSIYVCVCKVKNNLQRFCLEFITILTDTTSGGGERGRWAALSRSGQFVISLQQDSDMFKRSRLTLLYIIVPNDAGGRRRDCGSRCCVWAGWIAM